jgi:hypothetical protein
MAFVFVLSSSWRKGGLPTKQQKTYLCNYTTADLGKSLQEIFTSLPHPDGWHDMTLENGLQTKTPADLSSQTGVTTY